MVQYGSQKRLQNAFLEHTVQAKVCPRALPHFWFMTVPYHAQSHTPRTTSSQLISIMKGERYLLNIFALATISEENVYQTETVVNCQIGIVRLEHGELSHPSPLYSPYPIGKGSRVERSNSPLLAMTWIISIVAVEPLWKVDIVSKIQNIDTTSADETLPMVHDYTLEYMRREGRVTWVRKQGYQNIRMNICRGDCTRTKLGS